MRAQKIGRSSRSVRLLALLALSTVPGCHYARCCTPYFARQVPPSADSRGSAFWNACEQKSCCGPESATGEETTNASPANVEQPQNVGSEAKPEDSAQFNALGNTTTGASLVSHNSVEELQPATSQPVRMTLSSSQSSEPNRPQLGFREVTTSNDSIEVKETPANNAVSPPIVAVATRMQVNATANQELQPEKKDVFRLPAELPGASTPPLRLPDESNSQSPDERRKQIRQLFSGLPMITSLPDASPDPANGVLTLESLQAMAIQTHPALQAAASAVEAARGKMIQAGLPPNPNLGYEADTVRTINTNGYQGAYLQQTFITAGKLGLAARAAAVDMANAQLELRKTWFTVTSEIRRQYFHTLAARQRLKLATALLELSERSFEAQVRLVEAGEAAAYEPLQLRVLATQARASVIQAQQDSIAAWRALAASIASPALPPSALEGRIDCPVPDISHEQALERLLTIHTDIETQRNLIAKNRTLLRLAQVTPVPDLNVGVVVQRDYTFTPGTTTYNLMLGGAIPVFDRNQGGRIAARAQLAQATQLVDATQNDLIRRLAPIYGSYAANRQLAQSFRTDALQDQVRAYRGIYERYRNDQTGIAFNDVIVAQQTLAATLNQYIQILQNQWQAVVDLGEILQEEDIFAMGPAYEVAEIPEITQ